MLEYLTKLAKDIEFAPGLSTMEPASHGDCKRIIRH